jgi:hypothetical protein
MRDLFNLGYRMGRDGYPWRKLPLELEGIIDENLQSGNQE